MANKTERRGRGFAPKRITITAEDGAALRELLRKRHDYSAEEAIPAILSGELATVLLDPGVRARFVAWLESQPEHPDPDVDEAIRAVARQLC
ncbi:MAG TPA: hypothetical protein PKD53_27240 [Chloroflexaceae bacterium]|nr:hypothetical protein [Chloroflexaceae bacterium]